MNVTFFGAAGEVTGSCTLVETKRARVLVDFGQHQGNHDSDQRNRDLPPISPETLDAVVITHAHIDHIGRLPILTRHGYRKPIYATNATRDLMRIMLRDAGSLQLMDAKRDNQRNLRQGRPLVEPLFTPEDVERVLELIQPVALGQRTEVAPGVRIRYFDSGHIIGSASVEMLCDDNSNSKRLVFSGDVGPKGTPILRDFVVPPEEDGHPADLIVLESTYGDRDHRPLADTLDELTTIVKEAVWAKEKILIPAFAVGRAQTILYFLGELIESGRLPRFPVFLDSPMAKEASELYRAHPRLLDDEAKAVVRDHRFLLDHEDMRCTCSVEESKAINNHQGAAVVVAGSGMCTGGRILHHLKHNLWRKGVHVIIVGYQAHGTLGRKLVEGASMVRVWGEPITVRANIHTVGGLSAHAGKSDLLDWARRAAGAHPDQARFVLNHGEDAPRAALADAIRTTLGAKVALPAWGERIEI